MKLAVRQIALVFGVLLWTTVSAFGEEGATREECVIKSHAAAAMINAKGMDEAIRVIMDPTGPFVWKDSYVFMMDLNGKMLAHPMQPELTEKEHLLLMTDPTDKAIFVHFVNLARQVGHGWVNYMWPRPGKTTPSKKQSYVYRVPGQDVFVGAGIYIGGMMY